MWPKNVHIRSTMSLLVPIISNRPTRSILIAGLFLPKPPDISFWSLRLGLLIIVNAIAFNVALLLGIADSKWISQGRVYVKNE